MKVKPIPSTTATPHALRRRVNARMETTPDPPWMTPLEAAKALGISKPTLYDRARAGYIIGASPEEDL